MSMQSRYKKVALVACSNGQSKSDEQQIERLVKILEDRGLAVVLSPCLYAKNGGAAGTGQERAAILNQYFADESIDAIFDISGGDMANEVLPYLDYEVIAKSRAVFFGYSDLTTIINAIYTKAGKTSILYQLKNLVWDETGEQIRRFETLLQGQETDIFQVQWNTLQGEGEAEQLLKEYIVVGGNIRCFLKLAGTEFFPELEDKILFLESLGGGVPQIATYMAQLHQLGVFQKVKGILLGTFTKMEENECVPTAYEIMQPYLSEGLLVAQTKEVGHDCMSKALQMGDKTCTME